MKLHIDSMRKRCRVIMCTALLCAVLLTQTVMARGMYEIKEPEVPLANGATNVLKPTTGTDSRSGGGATIDVSNASEGYIMAKYSGMGSKIKMQVQKSGGTTYTYNISNSGNYEVIPLTSGNGTYSITMFENVSGNQYAMLHSTTVSVELKNSFSPFLYPNQSINFNADSATVKKGSELNKSAANDLAAVTNVFNYVIKNISYDNAKAASVTAGQMTGYLPKVDTILNSGKGICFDYAAVMATMLRSQGIPTRMELGYAEGGVYHAWVSVYITDVGWVNDMFQFDGKSWKLMDPTFVSTGGRMGNSYSTMYYY